MEALWLTPRGRQRPVKSGIPDQWSLNNGIVRRKRTASLCLTLPRLLQGADCVANRQRAFDPKQSVNSVCSGCIKWDTLLSLSPSITQTHTHTRKGIYTNYTFSVHCVFVCRYSEQIRSRTCRH